MNHTERETLAIIRDRHLGLAYTDPTPTDILDFITYTRHAGANIRHAGARSHLQTMLRYWVYIIFQKTGTFPDITLDAAREATCATI